MLEACSKTLKLEGTFESRNLDSNLLYHVPCVICRSEFLEVFRQLYTFEDLILIYTFVLHLLN